MIVVGWAVAMGGTCDVEVAEGRIVDPGLAFASRAATLSPEGVEAAARLACTLREAPDLRLRIEVHTDAQGADSYNLGLSQRRADALRDALIAGGVEAERLSAAGCGERVPIDTNATAEGRAKNRRIELWTGEVPGRTPCPPVEVPTPPPPPAAPAPKLPTDCGSWTALSPTRPPAWPVARCDDADGAWVCRLPFPVDEVVEAAGSCLAGGWDGPEWLASRGGFALVVSGGGDTTTIRAR